METPDVDILLSTFNGAKYLDEQIGSLAGQTHRSWRLLARDDGSTDGTQEILTRWVKRDPRITLVQTPPGNLGVKSSFFSLLEKSTAPQFMFCDQDDVWLRGKIAETLTVLRAFGAERPAAAFTDLRVVNERTEPVAESFMRYQRIDTSLALDWPRLLTQNVVAGCTLMGNAALRERALTPPASQREAALMHDGWLALIAKSMGELIFLDRPTVLYRQHGSNVLGPKRGGLARYAENLRRGKGLGKAIRYFREISRQAATFRTCYGKDLSASQRAILDRLADACAPDGRVRFSKWLACRNAGLRMTSWDQDVAVGISVLLLGRRVE